MWAEVKWSRPRVGWKKSSLRSPSFHWNSQDPNSSFSLLHGVGAPLSPTSGDRKEVSSSISSSLIVSFAISWSWTPFKFYSIFWFLIFLFPSVCSPIDLILGFAFSCILCFSLSFISSFHLLCRINTVPYLYNCGNLFFFFYVFGLLFRIFDIGIWLGF